jgi:GDSL-like Lipase/Acylhydrolase
MRGLSFLIVATLCAGVLADGRDTAWATTSGVPDSMAALGDSITQATNFDQSHFGSNPTYSWATGTQSVVQSVYARTLAGNPNITGKNFNYSVNGAKMVDLNSQAVNVNGTPGGVELVLTEMGGNDVCTSTEASMTPVATYRTQFQTAMNTLTTGFPNRRILALSVPDVFQLWAVLHDNPNAVNFWNGVQICQSLLANPTSMAQADVDRRARVRQRNIDFNTQLSEVCALYPKCQFDNNGVFNAGFSAADVSNLDYFHPSLQGQINLAAGAWAGYDMDADGWPSGSEGTITTGALDNCADTPDLNDEADDKWPADLNDDGFSDGTDITIVAGSFGKAVPPAGTAPARDNIAPVNALDGFVDGTDITVLAGFFGKSCGP